MCSLVSMPTVSGNSFYDRIQLKNRILPAEQIEAQASLAIDVTTAEDVLGFAMGLLTAVKASTTVKPASVYGEIGLTGSQATSDGSYPQVTLYPAGSTEQNNILLLTIDGVTHEIVFTFRKTELT